MADREKVINGLKTCIGMTAMGGCEGCQYNDLTEENCQGALMADALALLKKHGWYMLTEDYDGIIHGLPGDDGQYLMTDGKDIWIDEYVDGVDDGIFLDSGRDIREIMAWMYMPELPKKDGR